ncbi:MAG TPA: hypothetical protein VHD62_11380 [Opitutaceae bacterium]|nr:hypothetical protein [Opitutaceae bacterium]
MNPERTVVFNEPLPLRVLRAAALGLLACAITLLLGLLVLSFAPLEPVTRALFATPREWQELATAAWLTAAVVALTPVALLVLAWRLRLRSWWWVGGGMILVAPALVYLAHDDAAILRPVTFDEIAPEFPGAEKSFAVLMRYGKNHPLGRAFKAPDRLFRNGGYVDASKPAEWPAWLAQRRGDIEADWAELAPVRAWWTELAAFDRIGDLTPARLDAEIMAFGPVRSYAQHAIAIAGLQAIDGHGDEAFATLQPLLEVSRRLEPSARTLVRFMIARVMQRTALEAAGFVLDTTAVSTAARARFAAALAGGSGGEAGARRLLAIEEAYMLHFSFGDLAAARTDDRPVLLSSMNLLSPFVYNPRRTYNLQGELTARLQEFAARRDLKGFAACERDFFARDAAPSFKNFLGTALLTVRTPAYGKILESYWKVEDARTALAVRLAPR